MSTPYEELSQKVKAFLYSIKYLSRDDFSSSTLQDQKDQVADSLKSLVNEFGTCEYGFNLAIEQYVEYYSDETGHILPTILEENVPRNFLWEVSPETGIAFAAYYALSLIYKKNGDTAALKMLCKKPYTNFLANYPLTNEILARCHKRNGEYSDALTRDQDAIEKLKQQGIVNHGPCISFASTICRMLDDSAKHQVYSGDIEKAREYIEAAIAYNPKYPKYYYLRAKLAYYTALRSTDTVGFIAICDIALKDLRDARLLLAEQKGNYYDNTFAEYNELTNKITLERSNRLAMNQPFRELTNEELTRWEQAILASADASQCQLPPNPNLIDGEKYIFISYNHKDFQPVYCDLLRLYQQKFPFKYDEGLPYGARWDSAVKALIQSDDCVGVLFYISQNTLSSAAVETECTLLKQKSPSPRYLTVNLEGGKLPTDILIHYIQGNTLQDCKSNFNNTERIVNFLTMFDDKIKYFSRSASNYLNALLKALQDLF